MENKLHFIVVDDDEVFLEKISRLLTKAGHQVMVIQSSSEALTKIIDLQPDCVICDLLLPGIDGMELFEKIRNTENIRQPKFIILTGKTFEFDRRRALQLGVDGYLTKPIVPSKFVEKVLGIISDNMVVQFWGCRGTLPVPGKKTIKYGGNTNCITLKIAEKHFFIFDAGTGIKVLADYLGEQNKLPISAKIFLTHPHYDHINGIPFFAPLYIKGNEFEIFGADHSGVSLEKLVWNQMDSVYFPITMKEFGAKVTFKSITQEEFDVDDIHFKTILLNHPGRCLGYRVEFEDKIFCYITDNELFLENSPHYIQFEVDRLINFIKDANILIIDTSYSDEVYSTKVGWGHSCVSRVVDVADKAKVKLLCLHHHEPDETDEDIDLKLKKAKSLLSERKSKVHCIVPHEGDTLVI